MCSSKIQNPNDEARKKSEARMTKFGFHDSGFFRHSSLVICHSIVMVVLVSFSQAAEEEFMPLFDGKSLDGWHVSSKTGHSRASKNMSGGKWVVENGAMVGSQDIPGNG